MPNFSLNWRFLFFGPNLPKISISGQKRKKWTSPFDSNGGAHFVCFTPEILLLDKFYPKNQNCRFKLKFGAKTTKYQISAKTYNFCFFGPNFPKNIFPV